VRLAALHERALDVAGRLYRAGVQPGAVVVLQAAVGPASTEVAMALWALGAVPVLLVAAATPGELAHVVAETGALTVVAASVGPAGAVLGRGPAVHVGIDGRAEGSAAQP
jgi:acyl-CoA synthetase (AMP-forming)/AMP-acid ligase II